LLVARFRVDTSGVRFKVFLALFATTLALGGIALTAVRATRIATNGADRVETEFREHLTTEDAVIAANENVDRSIEAMKEGRLGAVTLAPQSHRSDAALRAAIGRVLAPGSVQEAEAGGARRVRTTYDAYRDTRDDVRTAAATGSIPVDGEARLRRAVRPLRSALVDLSDTHFAEAQSALDEIKQGGRVRNVALFLTVVFGVLSLVGIALLVRGIVRRVRAYGGFARGVAGGDLTTRLQPRGRDELDALGDSLNEMVDQLASAAREREELGAAERRYRELQDSFSEVLRVAESEREALAVLRRHIERVIPRSTVTVLHRNGDGGDVPAGDGPGPEARPAGARTCVAMRVARTLDSGADAQAMTGCEICGASATRACCVPLLVSGGVLGSVLVEHPDPLDRMQGRHLHDSVGQAAPILANLRTLALAQHRAATDPLTGLPNRRSVDAALRRMMAQSRRRGTPLAAIMIDLDHFKDVNDTFGHDQGDRVLAAVASTLGSAVRVSDFVGRTGGEEFIVLLPDSPVDAAVGVAEKLRAAVEEMTVAGVDRRLTASFGVGVHPQLADDGEALLRVADEALYAAKAAGRNRVQIGARGLPELEPAGVMEGGPPGGLVSAEAPAEREERPLEEVGETAPSQSLDQPHRGQRFRHRR
jgi:diguanylate cyclase (GGDEF)-like protein